MGHSGNPHERIVITAEFGAAPVSLLLAQDGECPNLLLNAVIKHWPKLAWGGKGLLDSQVTDHH